MGDAEDVAAAKAKFNAAFEAAAAGGLAELQAPAPVHEIPEVEPLAAPAPIPPRSTPSPPRQPSLTMLTITSSQQPPTWPAILTTASPSSFSKLAAQRRRDLTGAASSSDI